MVEQSTTFAFRELRYDCVTCPRLATGAYIRHAGWGKWYGNEKQAVGVHGMAATFPVFKAMRATDFVKMLSVGEMAVGAVLLAGRAARDRRRGPDRLLRGAVDLRPTACTSPAAPADPAAPRSEGVSDARDRTRAPHRWATQPYRRLRDSANFCSPSSA